MRRLQNKSGFTTMELIIVIGAILALSAFFLPRLTRFQSQANVSKATLQLQDIKTQLMFYRQTMGQYPKSSEGGLERLIKAPQPKGSWGGPYVDEKQLLDPWRNEIKYMSPPAPQDKAYGAFTLKSFGPDGEESEDDITVGERDVN